MGLDINKQFLLTLRSLGDDYMEAKQLFSALGRRPDITRIHFASGSIRACRETPSVQM